MNLILVNSLPQSHLNSYSGYGISKCERRLTLALTYDAGSALLRVAARNSSRSLRTLS